MFQDASIRKHVTETIYKNDQQKKTIIQVTLIIRLLTYRKFNK